MTRNNYRIINASSDLYACTHYTILCSSCQEYSSEVIELNDGFYICEDCVNKCAELLKSEYLRGHIKGLQFQLQHKLSNLAIEVCNEIRDQIEQKILAKYDVK
jgi:ATP-dependent protease Clp ATPase subunit